MRHLHTRDGQKGALSLEVVMVAPLFLIIIFAAVELSTFIYAKAALDVGCQQVARLVQSTPKPDVGSGVGDDEAYGVLVDAANGLDASSLSVAIDSAPAVRHTYTHHLPSADTYDYTGESRSSTYETVETTITCSYSYEPLTFIGLAACADDGKIRLEQTISVERTRDVEEAARIW